jgi:hypothetical protein
VGRGRAYSLLAVRTRPHASWGGALGEDQDTPHMGCRYEKGE